MLPSRIFISPVVGRMIPSIHFIVVVLPAPFGQRNQNTSPRERVNEIFWRSVTLPIFFVRCFIEMRVSLVFFFIGICIRYLVFFLSDLYSDFTYFISLWYISDIDILDRKITKNPRMIIDEMCMSCRITLIVCLSIDPRKTPNHTFFCHCFNISIYGCSSDFWIFDPYFIINILSWKVSAFASSTDDISILVLAHKGCYQK